jgi:hypothetical protein
MQSALTLSLAEDIRGHSSMVTRLISRLMIHGRVQTVTALALEQRQAVILLQLRNILLGT